MRSLAPLAWGASELALDACRSASRAALAGADGKMGSGGRGHLALPVVLRIPGGACHAAIM